MPKRFTDTEKWKKPFIRSIKAPYKLLWFYILDECDHAGIWQVDFDVARLKIGENLDEKEAIESLNGKIFVFDNGQKWFISDFIKFQYGNLNPLNRAHKSVISKLEECGLQKKLAPFKAPYKGAKDKDMDMEKDMDMDKGGVFFCEKYQIEAKLNSDGKPIYGNAHNRNMGGLSDEAMINHCKKLGIVYEPE